VIADLQAALEKPVPAPTNTVAPTTTTTNSSTAASTETTTAAMAVTVKLHETTQEDSEEHEGSEETRRDEIGEENNGEEVNECEQLIYKTDRGYECKTPKYNNGKTHAHGDEQWELEDGECRIYECKGLELGEDEIHKPRELKCEPTCSNAEVGNRVHELLEGEDYRIQEPDNGTTHRAPSPTANAAVNPVPREHMRFNWVTDINELIGPVPTLSDFRPTKVLSSLVSPKPTPHPPANLVTPAQPICKPPRPTVTLSNDDTSPCTCTPVMEATSDH
jgi:hypothetical protein